MEKILIASFCLFMSFSVFSTEVPSPLTTVQVAVEKFITVITNSDLDVQTKKAKFNIIVEQHMDLTASAQRVLGRYWQGTSTEDRAEFEHLFKQILVKTYFNLLNQYTNEEVKYINQKIRKARYAIVETSIQIKDKAVPVRYKLIKRTNHWLIYDVQAEGLSMVTSFNKDYQAILRTKGLAYLNTALIERLKLNPKADTTSLKSQTL